MWTCTKQVFSIIINIIITAKWEDKGGKQVSQILYVHGHAQRHYHIGTDLDRTTGGVGHDELVPITLKCAFESSFDSTL